MASSVVRRSAAAVAQAPLARTRGGGSRHITPRLALCTACPPLRSPTAAERLVIPTAASPRAFSVLSVLSTPVRRTPRDSIPAPPPLPSAELVRVRTDCALEYIDLQPPEIGDRRANATFVLLHGAPGTYQDFRYLVPHLQQQFPTARIIGINFPGFGGSTVDESRYFELLNAQRAAKLTLDALSQLVTTEENVFLAGHSFGGHAVLNLAALNVRVAEGLRVRGLVLLAAAGMTPHRVLRPRENELCIHALQASSPVVHRMLASVIKLFYTKVLRFPADFPASHFVAGMLRAGTTDFGVIKTHVATLRSACIPSLSAWSINDEFMEDEVPTALAQALGSSRRLAFASAGHNIQKTRAEVMAMEMKQWAEQVLQGGETPNEQVPVENRP